ncbi:MAG TPA: hypothetical protein VN420_03735 [Candidatus Fimivivens sp.]|nr:hypothetical protein [Candidatus Fimivivens sp.]
MAEKKRGSVEPIPGIEVGATEISVARNRAVEPYIKTFAITPENVTRESLGTLVGVFSVSDRSESSAYTVNVIASVARKEYYANPRRGAIESFESTLHRINLALSELVKNGQASWMGSLHGALAVVEGYSIHFSATGDGKVLLFREGTLSDIGDGLASEEAAQHPLKTFLEISSGRLTQGDCVLLTTPELLDLFSPRELERNANRLLPDGKFLRFLETAMVNELRAGAAVVLDARESKPVKKAPKEKTKPKHETQPETVNAWSEKTFREAAEERTKAVLDSYEPEQDISVSAERDLLPPTNEIRIQGEALENLDEHPLVTRARWLFEDVGHSIREGFSHSLRNVHRRSTELSESVSDAINTVSSSRIVQKDRLQEPKQVFVASKPKERDPITTPLRHAQPVPPPMKTAPASKPTSAQKPSGGRLATVFIKQSREAEPGFEEPRITLVADAGPLPAIRRLLSFLSSIRSATGTFLLKFLKEQTLPTVRTATRVSGRIFSILAKKFVSFCKAVWGRFRSLPPKRQLITVTVIAFLITILGTVLWKGIPQKKATPAPAIVEAPVVDPFPPIKEKAASLAQVSTLPSAPPDIVTPVYLGDSLFLVTRNGVFDTAKNTTSALPTSDAVRLASGMSDLNLIFLLTDAGDLYSFAPSNRAFVKNSISFPSGFRIAAMGDYLTYLYFLEEGTGKVFRFPRADGGFGDGTLWTKSPMPSATRMIAVSDSIFGSDGSSLSAFFRGAALSDFSQERPFTSETVTAVCANADVSDRVVELDAPAKRLVVRTGTGEIVSQLFDESFVLATACSLSGNGSTVAVSGGTSTGTVHVDTK